MNLTLEVVHFLAGLIVLGEALNKLERTDPLRKGLSRHARLVEFLKAWAWLPLAIGAGGAVASPMLRAMGVPSSDGVALLRLDTPTLAETLVLVGFAVLIVRTRVKEG